MSCTDCESNEIKYQGDGSQIDFTFPFTYIDENDVIVSLWDSDTIRYVPLVKDTDWYFLNATTIRFWEAPPIPYEPDPQHNIKISRCTDIDPLAATFFPGSAIRAQDLNDNFEQLQLAIQEGRCQVPDWLFDYLDDYYFNEADLITREEQITAAVTNQAPSRLSDSNMFSSLASAQRHDVYHQDPKPDEIPYEQPGKSWYDTATLESYVWDENAEAWINMQHSGPRGNRGFHGPPGAVIISDTQPTEYPASNEEEERELLPGDLWWNSRTANLFLYYVDNNSRQWVGISKAGAQGISGAPGQAGEDGKSAYEVALENGFVGSEDQWLDSLIGQEGPEGPYSTIIREIAPTVRQNGDPLQNGDAWFNTTNSQFYVYYDDGSSIQWVNVGTPGPMGPQGPQGLQGEKGEQGDIGPGLTLEGTISYAGPPQFNGTDDGDLWIDTNGGGWAWNTDTNTWIDVGPIRGPQGLKGDKGDKGDQGDQGVEGEKGPKGDQGIQGDRGVKGDKGDAATVSVGSTTTGNPGTAASVINSGTTSAAVFNFTIPRGDRGSQGVAATVDVGTTTTGPAGTNASVTNSGTSSAGVFNFTIPKGDKGDKGDPGRDGTNGSDGADGTNGINGAPGTAATISVGNTLTGLPGTNAAVSNVGNSTNAVFDFRIPRGDPGQQGDKGDPGSDFFQANQRLDNIASPGNRQVSYIRGDAFINTDTQASFDVAGFSNATFNNAVFAGELASYPGPGILTYKNSQTLNKTIQGLYQCPYFFKEVGSGTSSQEKAPSLTVQRWVTSGIGTNQPTNSSSCAGEFFTYTEGGSLFEWNVLMRNLTQHNNSAENCAFYAQTQKAGRGPIWGGCIEIQDWMRDTFNSQDLADNAASAVAGLEMTLVSRDGKTDGIDSPYRSGIHLVLKACNSTGGLVSNGAGNFGSALKLETEGNSFYHSLLWTKSARASYFLNGNTGHFIFGGGSIANANAPNGRIKIRVDGSDYYIPFYQ